MAQPLSFRWDGEFVARIDEARGLVPRSAFVRACVEQALAGDGKTWIATKVVEQALGGAVKDSSGVHRAEPPAPAERPTKGGKR